MNYYLNLNFLTGCSQKGHYAISTTADYFFSFMDRISRDGYFLQTFDYTEPSKVTYYCVYESESDVSDHVCFDDINLVGFILYS